MQFDETFTSVMDLVAQVVDFTVGGMAFVEEESLQVLLTLHRPAAPAVVEEAKARVLQAVGAEQGVRPFPRVETRLFPPRGGGSGGVPEAALHGFVTFPIATSGRLSGLLAVGGRAVSRLDADTHAFLGQVANQAHIVVENSRLVERLRDLAIRDSLTELYNHRHSMDLLKNEFERVGRYAAGLSLLMLDLDEFKRVNDEHGHPAGDAVLTEMARLLKETLRTVDSVGRYGGEEFVIILPHTSPEEAKATGERIRSKVASHVFWVGTEAPQRDRERGGGQLPHGQRGLAGEPGPRGRPRPLPREGGGTEPGGMRDERARTPRDVSVAEMEALLGLALHRGGDFADLYFEHEETSSLSLEEGIIRTATAGVSSGLGVRVVSGERSGYAYTGDLSPEALRKAAETAAYIALGTRSLPPERVAAAGFDRRYGARALSGLPLPDRIALVERADRAARAHDPRVEKVFVTLGESTKTVRIANSAGVLAEDIQPLFSLRVSVIAA